MYSSKCFNSNYRKFFGYETCENLIWTSGEGFTNTNTIRKQGIPKINMNITSPSSTLGLFCYPPKDTCDIFSEDFISHILQAYSSKNQGGVLRYITKVKSRHGILLPTICGYQDCGEK